MATFREIKYVKQDDTNLLKRWFTDDEYWDLFVWINKQNKVVSFQLSYSKEINEHALTWKVNQGMHHVGVNTSKDSHYYEDHMGSPILIADGYFDKNKILKKFIKDGVRMDPAIYKFIIAKIKEY